MPNDFIQSMMAGVQMLNQALQFQIQVAQQQQQLDIRRQHEEDLLELRKATLQEHEAALKYKYEALEAQTAHQKVTEELGMMNVQARTSETEAKNLRAMMRAKESPEKFSQVKNQVETALSLEGIGSETALNQELSRSKNERGRFIESMGGIANIKGMNQAELARLNGQVETAQNQWNARTERKNVIAARLGPDQYDLYTGGLLNEAAAGLGKEAPPTAPPPVSATATTSQVLDSQRTRILGDLQALSEQTKKPGYLSNRQNQAASANRLRDIITNFKKSGQPMEALVANLKNLSTTIPGYLVNDALKTVSDRTAAEEVGALYNQK